MSEDGPVDLTELEKARKWGKVANIVGPTIFGAIILGVAGCFVWLLIWCLIWALSENLLIGLLIIGLISIVSLMSWAAIASDKAEKLERRAQQYGTIDE